MKLTVPLKFAAGVYVNVPFALNTSVPLAAAVPPLTRLQLNDAFGVSVSLSLPVTLCAVSVPSSFIVNVSSFATGASFTGVTVMVTVVGSQAALGSQTWYVKLTVPLKFAVGK